MSSFTHSYKYQHLWRWMSLFHFASDFSNTRGFLTYLGCSWRQWSQEDSGKSQSWSHSDHRWCSCIWTYSVARKSPLDILERNHNGDMKQELKGGGGGCVTVSVHAMYKSTLTSVNQWHTHVAHSDPRSNQVSIHISLLQDDTALGLLSTGTAGCSFARTCQKDKLGWHIQKHVTYTQQCREY